MTESNEKQAQHPRNARPFVTVKYAQTLDGRIATATGDSRWISGPAARKFAHQLRREHDAVIIGIGTVLRDNPRLTVRHVRGRDPIKIVLDSKLRLPVDARLLECKSTSRLLVLTTDAADKSRVEALEEAGAEVITVKTAAGCSLVDVKSALELLGRRGVASVLVEGGAQIVTSALAARLVDRLVVITAPRILGQGIEAIGNLGIERLDDALNFSSFETRILGPDFIFDGRLDWRADPE